MNPIKGSRAQALSMETPGFLTLMLPARTAPSAPVPEIGCARPGSIGTNS